MEEQLTLYVRYTAKDGCREAFVREIVEAGIVTLIRQEPGCLAYDYYFSAQDENELLLIERWESAAHQRVQTDVEELTEAAELLQLRHAGVGLPLADGLAGDLQGVRQVPLGEAPLRPETADILS